MTFAPYSLQVQLINDAYNLVVDAIFGLETNVSTVEEPFSSVLLSLRQVRIPIASVDIPSGDCL